MLRNTIFYRAGSVILVNSCICLNYRVRYNPTWQLIKINEYTSISVNREVLFFCVKNVSLTMGIACCREFCTRKSLYLIKRKIHIPCNMYSEYILQKTRTYIYYNTTQREFKRKRVAVSSTHELRKASI